MLQLINANASVVAVTNTATALTDLIDTAAGADQQFPTGITGVTLSPEDGDVRVLFDGNSPTSSKGILLKQGGVYKFADALLSQIKLIRAGSANVAVGVQIGPGAGDEVGFFVESVRLRDAFGNGISQQTPGDVISGAPTNILGVASFNLVYNGTNYVRQRIPDVFKPQSLVSIASEATIWTPASNKKFRLMGGIIACSASGNIIFKDNTAGTIILIVPVSAGVPVSVPVIGNGILSAAANNVLTATGPAASTLSGTLFGTEE